MNMSDIPIYEQCKELEKENAELKALIAQRDKSITAQTEIILNLKAENAKLKSCLQEIKAIAENNLCSNCVIHKRECNCRCLADEILQKITKAEEE